MSRPSTYRVLVRKTELYSIDLPAHDGETAIERAERIWLSRNGHDRFRFERVMHEEPVQFEIDLDASLHLLDAVNTHRADWASQAIAAFAHETGTSPGFDALQNLLADLGHWADHNKLDFKAMVTDAVAIWDEEKQKRGAP